MRVWHINRGEKALPLVGKIGAISPQHHSLLSSSTFVFEGSFLSSSPVVVVVVVVMAAMDGSSSPPSDSNPSSNGASKFLLNLPSRGLFSSTVLSSNPYMYKKRRMNDGGGMRVYVCVHDTSPPGNRRIMKFWHETRAFYFEDF
ncbi:hypothetical protein G4B88_031511 [Cannabis sativa]|uniref:Uncharacterized protein n=1 Tax=Cannabis sativa TaxID=3483 RepID=A0A7J6G4C7_CANSA|nr:hypothetical protein G4B88_031511 [Cannabis sativa]